VARFIVGTGRCGSTLLSRMLAEHPAVTSLFECLNGLDVARRFSPEPVSGTAFAEVFAAEQPFLTAVLRRGYPVEEVVYPFDAPGARFARGEPMPYVAGALLPRLSDQPDALLDDALAFARALPSQPAPAHFCALFGWLAERAGRPCWIERSGSSIEYLPGLAAAFPGARFLHLHRDGAETALSMRAHHAYRLPVSVLYGAPAEDGTPAPEPRALDFAAAPTGDDPISRVLAARPSADVFGRYWSDQLVRGLPARAALGREHYAEVAFETLVAKPRPVLREVARFLELEPSDGAWLDRSVALLRGMPPQRRRDLDGAEAGRLDEACEPGRRTLAASPRTLPSE
jgi:hypothetical protein